MVRSRIGGRDRLALMRSALDWCRLSISSWTRTTATTGNGSSGNRRFMNANPRATDERRKRPLRYIEEEGIETAVWPHLYWDTPAL